MSSRPTTLIAICIALASLAGCGMPRSLPAVRDAGDLAYSRGDFATASQHYEEYVLRKPGDAEVEALYARTLLQLGRADEAIEHAIIAYDQFPNRSDFADILAETYFASGKTEQLSRFLRGNVEGRGTVDDYLRLGRFTARMGDADGAELALQTAAQVDQGRSVGPQLALADFYRSIGAREKEKQRLRMVLGIDVNHPDANRRLREMGEITGPTLALPPAERGR